jgi:hypothetical protein
MKAPRPQVQIPTDKLGHGDPEIRDQTRRLFILALAMLALLAVVAITIATAIYVIRKYKKVKVLFLFGIIGLLLIAISWTLMSYFNVVYTDDSLYVGLIGLLSGIALTLISVIWLIVRTLKALIHRNKPADGQQQTPAQ